MTGSTLDPQIDQGLFERGRWLLDQIRSAGEQADLADVKDNMTPPADVSLPDVRRMFASWAGQVGVPFSVDDLALDGERALHAFVTAESGRRWDLVIQFAPDPPHRIERLRIERRLPDGIRLRDAVAEDGSALAALYAATPMEAGDLRVKIDPGDDYFVMTRLMDHARTIVAVEDGEPIGLYTGTLYRGRLRGSDVRIALGCHTRIVPGKAGGGVWSNMNTRMLDGFEGHFDVALAFVLTGNAAASRLTAAGAWPAVPVRAVMPCLEGAVSVGRPATPADAATIAEVLNATHGRHDLYRPRTGDDIVRRIERCPELYGWDDVWLHDGAVVGVGTALHRRTTERPEGVEFSVRALVYDYGALPGSEDALVALLAARGAVAARRGATHLSVFTCEASPLYERLMGLATTTEVYDLFIPRGAPDDEAAARGVFVDQIHF